jgi:hypothetical protein
VGIAIGTGEETKTQNSSEDTIPKTQFSMDIAQVSKLVLLHELVALHARELETNQDFQPVVEQLHRNFRKQANPSFSWSVKYIHLNENTLAKIKEFDREMIKRIANGGHESWKHLGPQSGRLITPIHARSSSCVVCHNELDATSLTEGDIMRAAIVTIGPNVDEAKNQD